MKIIDRLCKGPINRPLYLALGNFDGVHRGHQAVIQDAVLAAQGGGGAAAALLFNPHPAVLLKPQKQFCLLTDIDERAALMGQLGLDYVFVEPFTDQTAATPPEDFIRTLLLEKVRVGGISIGADYSFGRGGAGTGKLLQEYGEKLGFPVTISSMAADGGAVISSSAIKELLSRGAVSRAATLLNYHFFRRGRVVPGWGRGKKLLFPTANLEPAAGLAWPGSGVYLTAVGGLERLYYGVTNVGIKPTFDDHALSVETYILDFEEDIYGRELTLYFLERLRPTRNFLSPEELRHQIKKDIQRGRRLAQSRFGGIGPFVEPVRFFNPPSITHGAGVE